MKQKKYKSGIKSIQKEIELSLITELKAITDKLGDGTKKLTKKIEQGSKKLAKKLSKEIKVVRPAVEATETKPEKASPAKKAPAKAAKEVKTT